MRINLIAGILAIRVVTKDELAVDLLLRQPSVILSHLVCFLELLACTWKARESLCRQCPAFWSYINPLTLATFVRWFHELSNVLWSQRLVRGWTTTVHLNDRAGFSFFPTVASMAITLAGSVIKTSPVVAVMRQHVSRRSQTCCAVSTCVICRSAQPHDVTARLHGITARVPSLLDHYNAVTAGLPASTLALLQRVLHAANSSRRHLVRPRHSLAHWLPITQYDYY